MIWTILITVPFLLIHAQTALALADPRTCYDAKNKATDHVPCFSNNTQAISHCCSLTDTCAGDTLCLSQWGTLYVGSCTVKDWVNGGNGKNYCPKYCSSVGLDIGACGVYDGGWEFCCGLVGGYDACCKEQYGKRFKIPGNLTNNLLVQRPWLGVASTSVAPSTSPTSATVNTPPSCPSIPSSSSKIGSQVGIGVGLGVPLLIALGLLMWENRKRRRAEARLGHQGPPPVEYAEHHPPREHQYAPLEHTPQHSAYPPYVVEGSKGHINEMPSTTQVHEMAQNERNHV
jgi:hypothetical protein